MGPKRTILFVAEAATLAHFARPAALAGKLDPKVFEVVLACDPRYQAFLDRLPFATRAIHSIPGERFLKSVAEGRPIFDSATLTGYVQEDLALFDEFQPAAVVGDLRLSLSVSARVAHIPYLAITTAYWSPFANPESPLPELPMNRWLGIPLAQRLFSLAKPAAFAYHAWPLNRVRRKYGLPPLPADLRYTYTDSDCTLYADARELVPIAHLPPNHHYIGPLLWSPPVATPSWWDQIPSDRPVVYATLGSSGDPRLLDLTLNALADLPITVLATTAQRGQINPAPKNAFLTDYAPGDMLAARADLVISNGGSLTVYQALATGKPIIGIAAHMDQHLSMLQVERAGVGRLLRSDTLTPSLLRQRVQEVLADRDTRLRAQELAAAIAGYRPAETLAKLLTNVATAS